MPITHDDSLRRGELCTAQRSLGSATEIPLRFVFLGLQPPAYWVWDWVAQGPPKGHAGATQAPRKRGPRVELNKCFVYNNAEKMVGGGRKN